MIAVLVGLASLAAPMTVDDAVNLALENAFSVRTAESTVERARQQAIAVSGNLGPQVALQGTYIRWDDHGPTGMGGMMPGSREFSPQQSQTIGVPRDSKQVVLSASQLVDITGVFRLGVRSAQLNQQAQQLLLEAEKLRVKQQARTSYYQVLQAKAFVTVRQEALGSSQQRLSRARIRYEAGDLARFDVIRLETEVKNAERELVEATNGYELSKQALNNLLGRPIETPFEAVDVVVMPSLTPTVDPLVRAARENRPEVQAVAVSVDALDKVRRAEERGSQPTLGVSVIHTRVIDPMVGQNEHSTYGVARISWPVFDSGITRANVRAARQDVEQAKLRLEQVQLGVSLEVRAAFTQCENALKSYEFAVTAEGLAQEAYRLAQLRFDEGAGILLDVITARADLTAARGNRLFARYAFLSAFASLQRAVGTDSLETVQP